MTVVSTIQALYSPIYNSLYAYMVARKRLLLFKRVVHAGLIGATTLSVLVVVFSELLMRILGGEGYAHGSYLHDGSCHLALFLLFGFRMALAGRLRFYEARYIHDDRFGHIERICHNCRGA